MEWRTLRKIKQSPQHCRAALQSTKQDSVEGLAAHKQPCLGIMPYSWMWDLSLPTQNTTVGNRALDVICLPPLAKVLKSFIQSYSKREAPQQQHSLGSRKGNFCPGLLGCKSLLAKPEPTWPSGVPVTGLGAFSESQNELGWKGP